MGRFLDAVRLRDGIRAQVDATAYPFALPLVASFGELRFPSAVTFFVGENGSGKSTMLEAIAGASGAVAAGSSDLWEDDTMRGTRTLASALLVERTGHARSRLFLRAEDVFGFMSRMDGEMQDLARQEAAVLEDGPVPLGGGRERQLEMLGSARKSLQASYGVDPHARSHGEVFLKILGSRLSPRGLYFLDEPETPLSPTRVLALIAMILEGAREGSQFVIATHSPMLLATPGATIYSFAEGRIASVAWDDVEHVAITRAFLRNPQSYLRHLSDDA